MIETPVQYLTSRIMGTTPHTPSYTQFRTGAVLEVWTKNTTTLKTPPIKQSNT